MDTQRAISHFLYYLEHHPALAGIQPAKVLLGHTADYEALTGAIAEQAGSGSPFQFSAMRLDLKLPNACHRPLPRAICTFSSTTLPPCPIHVPTARTLSVRCKA